MRKRKKLPVEPDLTTEYTCLNCGHTDRGKYCSACGQSFVDYKRPMKEVFHDLIGMISLDSSIFRTIRPFLFKPGFIAREYLSGKRKKYMSPVKLYLFMSILFFFVANKVTVNSSGSLDNFIFTQTTDSTKKEFVPDEQFIESLKNDTTFVIAGGDTIYRDTDSTSFEDKFLESAAKSVENPTLFITDFYKNISYSLFVLMPLFALILQLLFIRRKRYYVEHLVFTLNFHSFTLLILTILALLTFLIKGNDDFTVLLVLLIPVYFLLGMKRFYEQKFWKILLKSLILGLVYTTMIFAALTALAYLTMIRI